MRLFDVCDPCCEPCEWKIQSDLSDLDAFDVTGSVSINGGVTEVSAGGQAITKATHPQKPYLFAFWCDVKPQAGAVVKFHLGHPDGFLITITFDDPWTGYCKVNISINGAPLDDAGAGTFILKVDSGDWLPFVCVTPGEQITFTLNYQQVSYYTPDDTWTHLDDKYSFSVDTGTAQFRDFLVKRSYYCGDTREDCDENNMNEAMCVSSSAFDCELPTTMSYWDWDTVDSDATSYTKIAKYSSLDWNQEVFWSAGHYRLDGGGFGTVELGWSTPYGVSTDEHTSVVRITMEENDLPGLFSQVRTKLDVVNDGNIINTYYTDWSEPDDLGQGGSMGSGFGVGHELNFYYDEQNSKWTFYCNTSFYCSHDFHYHFLRIPVKEVSLPWDHLRHLYMMVDNASQPTMWGQHYRCYGPQYCASVFNVDISGITSKDQVCGLYDMTPPNGSYRCERGHETRQLCGYEWHDWTCSNSVCEVTLRVDCEYNQGNDTTRTTLRLSSLGQYSCGERDTYAVYGRDDPGRLDARDFVNKSLSFWYSGGGPWLNWTNGTVQVTSVL